MSRLVNNLIKNGYLKSDNIIEAFSKIRRVAFVPDDLASVVEEDIPLPIGHGQTISQPLTVAFMLELLKPQAGENILDVGSGSGWTTALLSQIVGEKGSVTSLEIIEELCELGKKNTDKYDFVKRGIAQFHCLDANQGYPKNAPYDKILVSAVATEIPTKIKEQLKVGGIIVIPINNAICYMEKRENEIFYEEKFPGFSFVPLVDSSLKR